MLHDVLVVVRCFNDRDLIGATLDAVLAQRRCRPRVVVIDSGSDDGSLEEIRRRPVALLEIPPGSYIPGKVLNLGMEQGDGPLVAFVNSDCTPQHDEWLTRLLAPFDDDPRIAATYGRQVPRPDAHPLVVKDYQRAFGDGQVAATWRHFFSMASSAIRRSVWAEHPFDPAIRYSEDIAWTWARRRDGCRIVYVPDSVAMHSHNYSVAQMRTRYAGEGRADGQIYPPELLPSGPVGGALRPWLSETLRDLVWCAARGDLAAAWDSPRHRWVQRWSYWRGVRGALAEQETP